MKISDCNLKIVYKFLDGDFVEIGVDGLIMVKLRKLYILDYIDSNKMFL
jgi:hypothetical protein